MFIIYLPKNLKIITLKNHYAYIYNNFFFFFFNYNTYSIYYNKHLNTVFLKRTTLFKKLSYKYILNNFFFSWDHFFFNKIFFLGKGFKLKNYKTKILLNFNCAHINIITNNLLHLKKIEKHKLILLSKKKKLIKTITNTIIKIQPINAYTKRGLRSAKQIIFKKRNKSSI